jgi:tetratricopeptide (TPR) repeat protein
MSLKDEKRLRDAHALHVAGDSAAAARILGQLLRKEPADVAVLTELAEIEIGWEKYDAAIKKLDKAVRIRRNYAPAAAALGRAYWMAGEPERALQYAERAAELESDNARHRLLVAQISHRLGATRESRATLETEIEKHPADRQLLGELYSELARQFDAEALYDAAIEHFERASAIDPAWVDAHSGQAGTLLRRGFFAEGWAEFERTRPSRQIRARLPPIPPEFFWDGKQALQGQTIAVVDDAGFGDAIQFFRYIRLLRGMGARILYRALPKLVALFRRSALYVDFVPELVPGIRFNFICLSYSLPALFGATLETIPNDVPYLEADPDLVRRWAPALAGSIGPRVGICWSGNPKYLYDYRRSMTADQFLPIADISGATFFSLQQVITDRDIPALERRSGIRRIGEGLSDFADTAAIIAQLDLVITTDTAVAHLAGALGRPVWLVLGFVPDWRWLLDRQDSPWYPTMKLFRQERAGEWGSVIERVKTALLGQITICGSEGSGEAGH